MVVVEKRITTCGALRLLLLFAFKQRDPQKKLYIWKCGNFIHHLSTLQRAAAVPDLTLEFRLHLSLQWLSSVQNCSSACIDSASAGGGVGGGGTIHCV